MGKSGRVAGHVFVSYVREDVDHAERLCRVLAAAGVPVWQDAAQLWPGQDWRARIRQTVADETVVFLACFSRNSTSRAKSFQNEELTQAVEQLRQRQPNESWLIPVRFDDCPIPDREIGGGRTLASLQAADLFGGSYQENVARLVTAIWRILGHEPAGGAAEVVAAAGVADFSSDIMSLVERIDEDAVRRKLPERLAPSGDVLNMSRAVRFVGRVREPPREGSETGLARHEWVYALVADRDAEAGSPLRSWEEFGSMYDRVVVLGDPGMGKSWLIRAETHRLAEAARRDLAGGLDAAAQAVIPVPVRAGVLAGLEGRTLAEAVTGYLIGRGWLAQRSAGGMRGLIDGGRVVLLVDAVDEIPERGAGLGSRQRLADLLREWAESCTGRARCVATSRLGGYTGPPLPGAREAELQPFTPDDVQAAVAAWDLPGPAVAQLQNWLSRPAVAAMARIPLLLALICSLAADPDREQPLPQTRADLYRAVLWQFLAGPHRADGTAAKPGETDRHALLAVLSHIAFTFASTSRGWIDQIPLHDLIQAIRGAGDALADLGDPPAKVLNRLVTQTGVLVPAGSPAAGEQDYLFLHRTIAEYLVARHLALLPAADRMRIVGEHRWYEPDWAAVFPMLGGMIAVRDMPATRDLVIHFLRCRPDPMFRMFGTGLRIIAGAPDPDNVLTATDSRKLYKEVLRRFRSVSSWALLVPQLAAAAAWPDAVTSAVLALATAKDPKVREQVARLLPDRAGAEPAKALLALAADSNAEVRRAAAAALARREGPDITGALLTLTSDGHLGVRCEAIRALAGRHDADASVALLALAADSDSGVRTAVARALAWQAGHEATSALFALAADSHATVRDQAARALGSRQGAKITSALLTQAARSDARAREIAVAALAWRAGDEAASALLGLATDSDAAVRRKVAWALAGRQGADITRALLTLATSRDPHARWVAAWALRGHGETDVTRALLALSTDSDPSVRRVAADSLTSRGDRIGRPRRR